MQLRLHSGAVILSRTFREAGSEAEFEAQIAALRTAEHALARRDQQRSARDARPAAAGGGAARGSGGQQAKRRRMPTVTLSDGTEVDSASWSWAEECAQRHRHVLNMRRLDVHSRPDYLSNVDRREGEEAGEVERVGHAIEIA